MTGENAWLCRNTLIVIAASQHPGGTDTLNSVKCTYVIYGGDLCKTYYTQLLVQPTEWGWQNAHYKINVLISHYNLQLQRVNTTLTDQQRFNKFDKGRDLLRNFFCVSGHCGSAWLLRSACCFLLFYFNLFAYFYYYVSPLYFLSVTLWSIKSENTTDVEDIIAAEWRCSNTTTQPNRWKWKQHDNEMTELTKRTWWN